MANEERVRRLVESRKRLTELRLAFAAKHGFSFKRSQDFKNCVVIRWKSGKGINHPRIDEYVQVCHDLCDKYDLWDKDDPFLDTELKLFRIGILVITEWDHHAWAVPDEYKEVQDYVLTKLPQWAKVVRKKKEAI